MNFGIFHLGVFFTLTISPSLIDGKLVFDGRVAPGIAATDFDVQTSALRTKFKQLITPSKAPATSVLSLAPLGGPSGQIEQEIGLKITNNSIFFPGDNPAKGQFGFRRTDAVFDMNAADTLTGTTVFHQTIKASSKFPLNITHGYLLASIEDPTTGTHLYDIFAGSDFSNDLTTKLPTANAKTIRVRDFATKTLFSTDFKPDTLFNFAVQCDFTKNQLAVFASTGDDQLKQVVAPTANDPKATEIGAKGEWHLQNVKFPLPNPKDTPEQRNDVPNRGLQDENFEDQVSFSRAYVESLTDGAGPTLDVVKGPSAPQKRSLVFV